MVLATWLDSISRRADCLLLCRLVSTLPSCIFNPTTMETSGIPSFAYISLLCIATVGIDMNSKVLGIFYMAIGSPEWLL